MPLTKKEKILLVPPHTVSPDYKALILVLLQQQPTRVYTLQAFYKQLNIAKRTAKQVVKAAVLGLVQAGKLTQMRKGRYGLSPKPLYVKGQVAYVNSQYAYIVTADASADIWVKQSNLLRALDQDVVKVLVTQPIGKQPEGSVVEIIKRNQVPWIGQLVQQGQDTLVLVANRRMHQPIWVKPAALQGAKIHDKVAVQIIDWPRAHKYPLGKVTQVLGPAGVHEVEMHAIMAEFGLPMHFPSQVLQEAQVMPTTIPVHEMAQRRDFRKVPTFTIDPADAKDFDDALSYQQLPNGYHEVGIHIADVSYYVDETSQLEVEAFKRGTSVYLVDRTVPMLPDKLANDLCSLKPHQDKLTFSAVFVLDAKAQLQQEWFGPTVIHSDRRFTYEAAQQVLTSQQGDLVDALTTLNGLAKQLRARRFRQGSINFETTEVKFQLDAQGKPLGIFPQVRQDTHKLIEEFMLLANQRVARQVCQLPPQKHRPVFIYRTHAHPDPEKLADFCLFVKQLGYQVPAQHKKIAPALNALAAAIEGKKEAPIIQTLAIRTMAKARYTTALAPHFALAFTHYTHFTSPIRRYPDMMVHRLLKQYLQGRFQANQRLYEEKCQHALARERNAAAAERASVKYKQVELLQGLQGVVLAGVISSVTDWGIYVAIETYACEGMVHLADMTDDYYLLEAHKFSLIGQRTKKIYRLGDQVKVQVKSCDIHSRVIDLFLVT